MPGFSFTTCGIDQHRVTSRLFPLESSFFRCSTCSIEQDQKPRARSGKTFLSSGERVSETHANRPIDVQPGFSGQDEAASGGLKNSRPLVSRTIMKAMKLLRRSIIQSVL